MAAETPDRDDALSPLAAWPERTPDEAERTGDLWEASAVPLAPPAPPPALAPPGDLDATARLAPPSPNDPPATPLSPAAATPTRQLEPAAPAGGLRFSIKRPLSEAPATPLRAATVDRPGMLVIAGSARPPAPLGAARRRRRPWLMQAAVLSVALCALLFAFFVVPALRDAPLMNNPLNAFTAFASGVKAPDHNGYTMYRVLSGDTVEAIAKRFGVTVGGIYELNNFHLGDEISIGQELKIPNDPAYGATFTLTAPATPPPTQAFAGAPKGTVFGGCVFCAIAGYSTGGACAPPSTTNLGYGLIQPNPNAKFIRGFTWYHNGVDLSTGQYGTPVVAAQDGQVIFSGWDPYGFGYAIKINHCWGLATSYGHMESLWVRVGQYVHKGQVIGLQGSTGMSTGPHVHFMVWWNNQYVNPLNYYTHLGFPYP